MTKKKRKSNALKVLLDVNAVMDMSPNQSAVKFEVVSLSGSTLTPQAIVDAIVDMVSQYYSVSEAEWKAMETSGLDS